MHERANMKRRVMHMTKQENHLKWSWTKTRVNIGSTKFENRQTENTLWERDAASMEYAMRLNNSGGTLQTALIMCAYLMSWRSRL